MTISKQTAKNVRKVLIDHLGSEINVAKLLLDLSQVTGNRSYRDSQLMLMNMMREGKETMVSGPSPAQKVEENEENSD